MLKASLYACVCVVCLGSFAVSSSAQEVIHALTGTVTAIEAGSITVLQDNGSTVEFQDKANPKTRINFDKRVAAATTAADAFKNKGAYVIVFYFGGDTNGRTVVALKDLGAGPFTAAAGTVEKFDGHAHSLSVTDKAGAVQTFKIGAETIAESDFGVIEGLKLQAQKGNQVRVVGATVDGTPTALFVREN